MNDDEIKTESLTSAEIIPAANPLTEKKFWVLSNRKKKTRQSLDIFKAIKYIYPLTIFIIVLILIWVMSFLYNNVYLTMTQAELVSSLKSSVIEESVNFKKFNTIVGKIAEKNSLSAWPYLDYLASPFSYGVKIPYPTKPAAILTSSSTPITSSSTTSKMPTTTKSTSTKY